MSCECLEEWYGPDACKDVRSLRELGPRRAGVDYSSKPFVRMTVLGDTLKHQIVPPLNASSLSWFKCDHSVCLVSDNKEGVWPDIYLASCDDHDIKFPGRGPWQEAYLVGLGDGQQCQPTSPRYD